MCCIFYFLVKSVYILWMRDIWISSICKKQTLSIGESCVMWYFMNTMMLFIVHAVVVTVHLNDVTNLDGVEISILVYTTALYSVFNSTVPVRLLSIGSLWMNG